MAESATVLRPRISKSCDQCKARKVRCIRDKPDSQTCNNCLKRRQQCHFSQTKRKLRLPESENPPSHGDQLPVIQTPSDASLGESAPRWEHPQTIYIDHLLEKRYIDGVGGWRNESSIVKADENLGSVASASLAFFSESRIRSLSERLGHSKLRDLIEAIGCVINARMNRSNDIYEWKGPGAMIKFKSPATPEQVSAEAAAGYIAVYFEQVHPIYPFLDRQSFEEKAHSRDLPTHLSASAAFSALYHSVLALGCQYTEGGSFETGKGKAWKLYQIALGLFPDLLLPREALENLQTIFALNLSCIQIEETLISEAARMAQALGYNRATSVDAGHRTFWVIYTLEKTTCFFAGTSSGLSDFDIGCPLPEIPETVFGGVDWFLSSARFARLVSRAYEMLFSVTATMKTPEQYFSAIDQVNDDLDQWRNSLPVEFRPGDPFRPGGSNTSWTLLVALRAHFFYHAVVIALCRLTLHVGAGTASGRMEDAKKRLMYTARQIIENTRYIDAEPYTPIWMLGVIPLSALFILFDFVVHNPSHPETSTNLALLDVAGGYFSRLEYATGGSLPSSLLSDFAHIARQFVRDINPEQRMAAESVTRYTPYLSTKSFEGMSQAPQPMTYLPTHLPTNQMPIHGEIPNQVSVPYTDQLFYPTTDLQPLMGGNIPSGFDITNLFDAVIPEFPNL
ncbi:fungal-specific transcription factor domain-containing protein [Talaromyces proteolyticus]|uniref:Fungal-specific transcription factor domain-containing protein n=1 Tax=Talaromyces proteolyticus TaxID=1131652 RepID=A0AAD4KDF2_9EURO|nr:fungal-specific transcription factor domain-containing protein [Talaromyces proteolyticus]KAH8689526.1 fungal-specific transcription factor domain-containing protein [Talaromyces proteolyticus]